VSVTIRTFQRELEQIDSKLEKLGLRQESTANANELELLDILIKSAARDKISTEEIIEKLKKEEL